MEQTEITLLEALYRIYDLKAKNKHLRFEITFNEGLTRKASFSKKWSRTEKKWLYLVQESQYVPSYAYGEREFVSAIMSIPGLGLRGNTVNYHICQM